MSHSRDRDAAVGRWLRRTQTSAAELSVTDACLDAEVLAAWADGGLAAEARAGVEGHLASCARCQTVAGTMARTESIAAWAAPERRSPWRWLTWAVPLSAAATIAMLIVTDRRTQVAVPQSRTEAPPVATARPSEPAAPRPNERSDLKDQARATPARDRQAGGTPTLEARRSSGDHAKTENEKLRGNRAIDAVSSVSPPARGAAAAPAPDTQAKRVEQKAAAAQTRAEESDRFARRFDQPILEIRSPNTAVRWRAAGATVERSVDAGTTWTAVPTGLTSPITAGAAPDESICWLAARGGIVLLSTDGTTWQRVSSPTTTDLSAIRASDARNATVTTADGREFATNDGGRTWVRRDVQETPTAPF